MRGDHPVERGLAQRLPQRRVVVCAEGVEVRADGAGVEEGVLKCVLCCLVLWRRFCVGHSARMYVRRRLISYTYPYQSNIK